MTSATEIHPESCPLCGTPNRCAVAAGEAPESCWCMSAKVSEAALERLPEAARGKACICARCAAQQGEPKIER